MSVAMHSQGATEVIADTMDWIQRSEGVLKNQLYMAPISAQGLATRLEIDWLAVEANDPRGRVIEAGQHAGHRCLTTAALTYHCRGAPGVEGQRSIFHGVDSARRSEEANCAQRKILAQMLRFQHGFQYLLWSLLHRQLLGNAHTIALPSARAS